MKKVVVSVTNDLVTDQRVARSINVLLDLGFEVTFVGRKLSDSMPIVRPYQTVRFKLWFNKGFLFYAAYNIRLFFFLMFRRFDIYLSNDLDTLLPNYLWSRIRNKPLVYDAHEYFTGVPEIQHRPLVKKVWKAIEEFTLPKIKYFITVNNSIRKLYKQDYGLDALVIRNISDSELPRKLRNRVELGLPADRFLLINQGAGINIDRGMEEVLEALKLLDNVSLVLVGKGDIIPVLREKVLAEALEDKVIFISPKPYLQMLEYTLNADCGLSLDKSDNLNYRFSLPNKLFDYIKCGIPVVASDVVEVSSIVRNYEIGEVIEGHQPHYIAKAIEKIRSNTPTAYKKGLEVAQKQNKWELEREKLLTLFETIGTEG